MNHRMFVKCNIELFEPELVKSFPLNRKHVKARLELLAVINHPEVNDFEEVYDVTFQLVDEVSLEIGTPC